MFYRAALGSGLRIVGETVPGARTFAAGVWVRAGSVWEDGDTSGISHFLEHMAFKGTSRHTARETALIMDRVGGDVNAYTDREYTCYYGRTLYEDAEKLMDILGDMVIGPLYLPGEVEKERGVILEEIDMAEDTPEDVAQELLMEAMYGGSPLARPVLGTKKNVRAFTRRDIDRYRAARYLPQESVLSVAGRFDWERVLELADRYFGSWKGEDAPRAGSPKNEAVFRRLTRRKSIEQAHICLGWEGVGVRDPDGYATSVLSNLFGGASSSRLFQKVREECGLAYSIYSDASFFDGTGLLSVYAAVSQENLERVRDILYAEAEALARDGAGREELASSLRQFRSEYLIGGESASACMQINGRRLLLEGCVLGEEEILEKLDAISLDQVNALAARIGPAFMPCASPII